MSGSGVDFRRKGETTMSIDFKNPKTPKTTEEVAEVEEPKSGATESADEIISPRDSASGLPTGKRMHKPL
jgi:hypothetical protein